MFVHALNTVKRIPRTGSARPPTTDRLKLYGLYKQSTEGDVEGLARRPEGKDADSIAERDKWYSTPVPFPHTQQEIQASRKKQVR